jgi:tetratricopeptide (TPR) repeat protein
MITMLMDMARLQPDADRDRLIGRARTLLASLSPEQQATPSALVAREMLWERVAALQVEARDYPAADLSRQHYVEAAEERLRQSGSLEASYNLSLGYKYRGATLEMLGRQAEAIDLYRKAARLDQQRIDRDPGNAGYRLDLSFAEASLAAALLSDGDFAGARAGYERAVAMREAAVAQDPANDFARTALARGYDRLAGVYRHLQDVPLALAFNDKALALYRRRMQEHPERDFAWREHVSAVVSDVRANIGWLATCPRQGRPALRAWAAARLDEIDALEQRWTSEKHAGALAPASIDLRALRRGLVHP